MQQNAFFSLEQVIDRQPLTVSVETSLSETIALMHQHGNHCTVAEGEANNAVRGNSSCVLVVEGERLRGIFTERDLVKLVAKGIDTRNATLGEMMTADVVTIVATDEQDIFAALTLLKEYRIRHLPVVDEAQNLLGLITAKNIRQKLQPINLMKWRKVAEVMESTVVYAAPDESIRSIASLMADNKISCVAIAETQSNADNRLVQPIGIITERDIVQFQNLGLDLELPARDYMSAPLFLVSPADSLWDIYQQMKQRRVRRLLVGGDRGELAGIITQSSLLQVFDPTEMYGAIEVLQRQVCQLETEREVLLQERNDKLEREVQASSQAIAVQNQELEIRLKQQQVVAEIGTFALTAKNLLSISQRVVELVASTLEVEYCKVLELCPDGKELLLKAGVGWHDGLVGTATVRADTNSQAGYTLLCSEPVIVYDLNSETRFIGPSLLTEHRVVSGVSVIVPDTGKPYGILGVHTTQHRVFTQNDLNFLGVIANILAQAHERQQVEFLLRESQERYDLAVRGSSDGLWDWNIVTDEVFYSSRFKEMLGYSDEEMSNAFTAWSSKLHPEDRERILKALQNHLEHHILYDVEYRLQTKQGTYDWFQARGQAIWNKAGKAIRMAGSITDIGDRKQIEAALRESEHLFRNMSDNAPMMVWVTDETGNCTYVSQTWREFSGQTEEIALRLGWLEAVHLDDRDRAKGIFLRANERQEAFQLEYRVRRHDGEYRWAIDAAKPWIGNDGKFKGYIGSVIDISDRKRKEQILKDVASAVTSNIGLAFYESLVSYLANALNVKCAMIGKLIASEQGLIETLAMYFDGQIKDNFQYDLADTPCENVIKQQHCTYPNNIKQRFPKDKLLQKLGVESYAGIPLLDSQGSAFGLVAILDDKPLEDTADIVEVLKIFAARIGSEIERQKAEVNLQQSNCILQAISSIQTQFLTDAEPQVIFDGLLEHLLELTESEYGFIGEIHVADDGSRTMEESYMKFRGRPFLKTHAITNIAWNEETKAFYAENAPKGMEFHNLQTLFGAVIVTGEPVIANSPSDDPRRGGLPDGHPLLNAFLGIPFYKNGQMTGMAGIANRSGGYEESTIEYLRPLLDTCSRIIEAYKSERQAALRERQRQQAEAKIREQAALLDIANDAIMVRDSRDRILFWNRGAEQLYGWTKAEALNKNAKELFNRRSTVKLSQIHQAVREKGEWQGELQQVTKDEREVVVNSRWTLVEDREGNPPSYLVVKTDITEQKQLETQFLRTQRLESLGTLAGGIAHDLNNILAPILGFSKLLPLKLPDVDEQTKGFFKIMENNANRGTALVKQILTFSRGLEGERGIVQIRHLINEIAQIINETFPKSIQLETSAPKTLWTVNADVNQLHQVLMNLSVNARDAMTDGGTLTINAENTTFDAEYARLHLDATVGDYVLITVSDTGVGISPKALERIFEPFFTTKEVGRGTGLGLSTVIGIVQSHGGFIDVESSRQRATRGTKFKVFLPASNIAENNIEEPEADLRGNSELILVVDDETAILEVTKATLETYNYQVLTANDGIRAIATYAQNQENIKAVIMDIMMPNMDGKTAIRTLKQINPELKIIAVSGLISSQEIVGELDSDVTAFMNKPYSNDDLLKTIGKLLNT